MKSLKALLIVLFMTTPVLAGDWKGDIEKTLSKRKVTLQFNQTPLTDVMSFMRDITQINMVVDPGAQLTGAKVNLNLKNVKLSTALDCIVATVPNTDYKLAYGMLIVTKKERLEHFEDAKAPANSNADQKKLWESLKKKTLTLNFVETSLKDIVQFLQDITGENMMIAGVKLPRVKVTLQAKKVGLDDILTYLAKAHNFEFGWKAKVLVFQEKAPAKKVTKQTAKRKF